MFSSSHLTLLLALIVAAVTASPMATPFSHAKRAELSTSPAVTVPRGLGASGGKRGILFDWLSKDYSKFFVGGKATYASNWHATAGETGAILDPSFGFIPTLIVDQGLRNDKWLATVKGLIKGGVKTVFASNEPDHPAQANLTPAQAAQVYKQYMMPLHGLGAQLCTPSVTNGVGTYGLDYLQKFVGACTGCVFDVINIHHYLQRSDLDVDGAVRVLKTYIDQTVPAVQRKYPQLQGLKIFLGEFWLWNASEAEGAEYLQKILPYLDNHPNIVGYQAFGGLWEGRFINAQGNGLTPAGSVYRNL